MVVLKASASSAKVAQASVLEHGVLGCAVAVPPAPARGNLAAPDVEVQFGANTCHNGSAVDGSVGVPEGVVPSADQSLLAPTASPQHSTANQVLIMVPAVQHVLVRHLVSLVTML